MAGPGGRGRRLLIVAELFALCAGGAKLLSGVFLPLACKKGGNTYGELATSADVYSRRPAAPAWRRKLAISAVHSWVYHLPRRGDRQ